MNVTFVARGGVQTASSRFRAWNIVEAWQDRRVRCHWLEQIEGILDTIVADVIVLQKPDFRRVGPRLLDDLAATGTRLICDIPDPVWCLMKDADWRDFASRVHDFVVSNPGLGRALEEDHGIKSTVIADRMPYTAKHKEHRATLRPIMVWFGQSFSREVSLASVGQHLARIRANDIPFTLRMIDESPEEEFRLQFGWNDWIDYRKWNLQTFEDELIQADFALLPGFPGRWGQMKSWNKPITASWAGLPVTDGQSYDELYRLLTDVQYRTDQGAKARAWAEREGDVRQSVQEWKDLLGWK